MKIQKLEAIRGFAAVYVLIHHYIGYSILRTTLPSIVRFPFRFGQEAVILFFLLSGFVIYLSSIKNPHLSFRDYFLRRFLRIYPLVILSFLLSIFLFWINGYNFSILDLKELAGNMIMLQDTDNKPGSFILPFLKNFPLWSLSYEWWFYLLFFPIFIFLYQKQKSKIPSIYIALTISIIGWFTYLIYPNHIFIVLAYFVIWWTGVSAAEIFLKDKNWTFKNMFPILISLFIMTCLSTIPIIQSFLAGNRNFSQIEYPILPFRHIGFAFVLILLGIIWYKYKLVLFDSFFGRFEKFASISYGIYILHFPFIWLNIPVVGPYIAILIKLILAFLLAYILELKIQPYINKFFKSRFLHPKNSVSNPTKLDSIDQPLVPRIN